MLLPAPPLRFAPVLNINDPVFDEPREHPGFRCVRARLSRQAGSERWGLSLWEVPAGEAAEGEQPPAGA
jgi:hypothetical protein